MEGNYGISDALTVRLTNGFKLYYNEDVRDASGLNLKVRFQSASVHWSQRWKNVLNSCFYFLKTSLFNIKNKNKMVETKEHFWVFG